jgi:hypothetical protein
MLIWGLLAFNSCSLPCPADTPFYYESATSFSVPAAGWRFFWSSILSHSDPVRISVSTSGPYSLYVGDKSECPNLNNTVLLASGRARGTSKSSEFFGTEDNYAQAFGFYVENETEISVTVQNVTEIHRTRSAAKKLAIAVAVVSFGLFVYYLAVVIPRKPKFPLE